MTTTHTRPRTRRVSTAATAVLCAFMVWTGASPAQAHSELTSSTPAAKARLSAAPATVTLVFSDKVEPRFTNVALTVGTTKAVAVKSTVDGKTVTATIPEDERGPGAWKVSYRVVSADGHPISGTIAFTVTGPATPTQTPTTPAGSTTTASPTAPASASSTPRQASEPSAPSTDRIDRSLLLWLGVVIALMAALAYAVWLSGKSNR